MYGIAAMQHLFVSDINSDVRYGQRGAVRSGKENQVAGFRLRSGNRSADVIKSLRSKASDVPSAMIDDPRHKAGTVKRRGRAAPAPDIRITQILFGFFQYPRKGYYSQPTMSKK